LPCSLPPLPRLSHPTKGNPSKAFPPSFPPVTSHQSRVTNFFRIRTYKKCVHNPFEIRTSKTKHLKPFRMNTYEKTGGRGKLFSRNLATAGSDFVGKGLCPGSPNHNRLGPVEQGARARPLLHRSRVTSHARPSLRELLTPSLRLTA
jgi:hypothetical protein